jgi:hypothetical protein
MRGCLFKMIKINIFLKSASLFFLFTLFIIFSSNFVSAVDCNGNPYLNCGGVTDSIQCQYMYGGICTWTGSSCANVGGADCSMITNQFACISQVGCSWSGPVCSSGVCCVGGQIASSGTACASETRWICTGQTIQLQARSQYCSGYSATSCGEWESWNNEVLWQTCIPGITECVEGQTSSNPFGCSNIVPPGGCLYSSDCNPGGICVGAGGTCSGTYTTSTTPVDWDGNTLPAFGAQWTTFPNAFITIIGTHADGTPFYQVADDPTAGCNRCPEDAGRISYHVFGSPSTWFRFTCTKSWICFNGVGWDHQTMLGPAYEQLSCTDDFVPPYYCRHSSCTPNIGYGTCCYDSCSSLGFNCGVQDVCGYRANCGTCSTPPYNVCSAGHCICTETCENTGNECGTASLCGVPTDCGTCASGSCTIGTPNTCTVPTEECTYVSDAATPCCADTNPDTFRPSTYSCDTFPMYGVCEGQKIKRVSSNQKCSGSSSVCNGVISNSSVSTFFDCSDSSESCPCTEGASSTDSLFWLNGCTCENCATTRPPAPYAKLNLVSGGLVYSTCNDNDACTSDTCVGTKCVYTNICGACTEGDNKSCSSTNAFGTCLGNEVCSSGAWSSCSAAVPAAEICNDGIDNNCDGNVDCDDSSCTGNSLCAVCDCSGTSCNSANNGQICDGCNWVDVSGVAEVCNDGVDNDCNGLTNCNDPACIGGPSCCNCGGYSCNPANNGQRCDGCYYYSVAFTPETCNNADDNCNGVVDEGVKDFAACNQLGNCAGAFKTCNSGGWSGCSKLPGPVEICSGGGDENCNGLADCADLPYCLNRIAENCFNGKDDDCDGAADSWDSDCCNTFDAASHYFEIRNNADVVVARIDKTGVLWIKGTEQSWANPSGSGNFVIQDSSGSPVFWIQGSTGNLYLKGGISIFYAGSPSGSGNFVVQNSAGTSKAWVNSAGNIYLGNCIGYNKVFS